MGFSSPSPLQELWAARPWQPRVSACLLAFEGSERQGRELLTSGNTALAVSMWTDLAHSWLAFQADYQLGPRTLQVLAREGARLSTLDTEAWTDEERLSRRLLALALRACGWRDGVAGEVAPPKPGRPAISGGSLMPPAPTSGLMAKLQRLLSLAYQWGYTAGCAHRLLARGVAWSELPKPAKRALRKEARSMRLQLRWLTQTLRAEGTENPPSWHRLRQDLRRLFRRRLAELEQFAPALAPQPRRPSEGRSTKGVRPSAPPPLAAPAGAPDLLGLWTSCEASLAALCGPQASRLTRAERRALWQPVRTQSPHWAAQVLAMRFAIQAGGDASLEVLLRELGEPAFWEDDPRPLLGAPLAPGLFARRLILDAMLQRLDSIRADLSVLSPALQAAALSRATTRTPVLASLVQQHLIEGALAPTPPQGVAPQQSTPSQA